MKIDSLSPVEGHKSILARFNVWMEPGITIRDVKIVHGKTGRFIAWPNRQYKDKEGQDKYFSYVIVDKEIREKFDAQIFEQIDKMLPAQNQTQNFF